MDWEWERKGDQEREREGERVLGYLSMCFLGFYLQCIVVTLISELLVFSLSLSLSNCLSRKKKVSFFCFSSLTRFTLWRESVGSRFRKLETSPSVRRFFRRRLGLRLLPDLLRRSLHPTSEWHFDFLKLPIGINIEKRDRDKLSWDRQTGRDRERERIRERK